VTLDTFAHNQSGVAYQDESRRLETVVHHKRQPLCLKLAILCA
jgi:hypothetical protein